MAVMPSLETRAERARRDRRHAFVVALVVGAVLLAPACSEEGLPSDPTRPDEPLITLPGVTAPVPDGVGRPHAGDGVTAWRAQMPEMRDCRS